MKVKELIDLLQKENHDVEVKLDVKGVTAPLMNVDWEYDGREGWVLLNDYHPHGYRKNLKGVYDA